MPVQIQVWLFEMTGCARTIAVLATTSALPCTTESVRRNQRHPGHLEFLQKSIDCHTYRGQALFVAGSTVVILAITLGEFGTRCDANVHDRWCL